MEVKSVLYTSLTASSRYIGAGLATAVLLGLVRVLELFSLIIIRHVS